MQANKRVNLPMVETNSQKTIPSFLKQNYPYQSLKKRITDPQQIKNTAVYEIKCNNCETSIRLQGKRIPLIYERIKGFGCLNCGNIDLFLYSVDINRH